MSTLMNCITEMISYGKYLFTTEELMKRTNTSRHGILNSILRLKKKGILVSPYKGVYVFVPYKDRLFGCLPAAELIPLLMSHLKQDYYVCLLSASFYHEASHQAVQIFQVMTNRRMKNIDIGKVSIQFSYKKDIQHIPVVKKVVSTGYLHIGTPEITAVDLFDYMRKSGGLNHIATILSELVPAINITNLRKVVNFSKKSAIQRMGYVLEVIDTMDNQKKQSIIKLLEKCMKMREYSFAPLAIELPVKGKKRNKKWKIIENTTIESDL